ncbi:PVC-type heme-binding CxxCH protein [Verrucomicrobiales bacterium BCK34]|nr:PVC-type heme-binding CxxCH protein [Verrucomicrobiales bacterium BCK34]
MKLRFSFIIAMTLCSLSSGYSYDQDRNPIKITKSSRTKALSHEEELSKFTLADGFIIELVASEENGIINPIDLTFDDAGRLWTQTAEMYPLDPMGDKANRMIRGQLLDPKSKIHEHPEMVRLKRLYELKDRGTDRIVVIDDPTKPVEGQVRHVAGGLTMPQSILPYKNGVYVAHGSEMLYLEDADGDGVFEKPTTILTGFSFIDSHTMSHLLTRAPGGWINFSHGAMNLGEVTAVASGAKQQINYSKIARFSLDGRKIELVASGLNNIWGYQLRANGQWYGSEANDKGMSIVPMEAGTGYEGIGNDKLRPYQPMMPQLHPFRVGGTGLSGLAFSEDDAGGFPEKWREVALLANPITNTINAVKIDRDASGAVRATHLEDLLKCEDDWFRPVNLTFGPDGCLYVADWYNKVVSHNEIPRSDPSRDKTHGRIWRIRHVSQEPVEIPNVLNAGDEALIGHLTGPSRWEKRAAWHQIADRQAKDLLPRIKEIAVNRDLSVGSRVHAIWSYESLGAFDEGFTRTLLDDEDHNIRREIIRSLASFNLSAGELSSLVAAHIEDSHCMVRSQVLRTLGELGKADHSTIGLLIEASKSLLPGKDAMGGTYERRFERYLARKAMESYRGELKSFLSSSELEGLPRANVLWAYQSLDEGAFAELFPRFWTFDSAEEIDEELFISLASVIGNEGVRELVSPIFSDPKNFSRLSDLLIQTRGRVDSSAFKVLFGPIISSLAADPDTDRNRLYELGLILKTPELGAHALAVLEKEKNATTIKAALPVLMLNPEANMTHLAALAEDESLPASTRLEAVIAYNLVNPKAGYSLLLSLVGGMEVSERGTAVDSISLTTQGAGALAKLLSENVITVNDFNYLAATRVAAAARKNPSARRLMKAWSERKRAEDLKFEEKVEHLADVASTLPGNPAVGQGMFQMCLACHAVGTQGHSIAPALDGSASRETHALLTALIRPDVAVEGGYELYRVIRKDGTMVEGYLYSSNEIGVTVAVMGGHQIFTPRSDVKAETSVPGKSFMPPLLNGLPEQNIVDLLSYIKTLK